MTESLVQVEVRGRAACLTLNRPEARNALNRELVQSLLDHAVAFDNDPGIGAIIITGDQRAFAAGADIAEMAPLGYAEMSTGGPFPSWVPFEMLRTPVIAAVSGYALGGGMELAMMCDIVIAGESAIFGQPEINLGILPGFGGTQRLPRAIGPAKAADMILSARNIDAAEAERAGLVSRVVKDNALLDTAWETARAISEKSPLALAAAKEALQAASEMPLTAGLQFERRLFAAAFATEDQKEGMAAFLKKRPARFRGV